MKRLVKLLIIVTIFFISVDMYSANVITKNRTEEINYGVNKKWEINNSNLSNVLKTPFVDASEKIYDFSDILTDIEEKQLKVKIDNFIRLTNIDMVIVTENIPYVIDLVNEEYAADFYDYNDFGIDFTNYSGVLFFRNTYESDRYYNIYTFGDAQLYFSFERLEETLDNVYYDISNEYYLNGFTTFINDMTDYYKSGIPDELKNYYIDDIGYIQEKYNPPIFLAFIISLIITIIIISILIKKNKMIKKEKEAKAYLEKETINYSEKKDIFITSKTTSYVISGSSSGSGGSSSRGSSGGGHSSGGGRHG